MTIDLERHQARLNPTDRLIAEPPQQFPAASINITNRCNLTCSHCYLYKDGNPSLETDQIEDARLLIELERIRDRHGIRQAVWLGGEPMIRWRLLEKATKMFASNTITTNGTIPLRDFGSNLTYVVSLDGPEDLNDHVRGKGVYKKARATIDAIPEDFAPTVQVQCCVTKLNQHRLGELVADLVDSRVDGVAFTFYCPVVGEDSELSWADATEREVAVDNVLALKEQYPEFVWNSSRALELMRAPTAKLVTDGCPTLRTVLPLFVEGDQFVTPRCCYGNEAECDRCGGWVVFAHAAKIPGPWNDIVPGGREDWLADFLRAGQPET